MDSWYIVFVTVLSDNRLNLCRAFHVSLHVFDLEKIGSNTILPFSFLNSDYKYLFACIALVLSLATVIYKYRKNNTGERVLFSLFLCLSILFLYH